MKKQCFLLLFFLGFAFMNKALFFQNKVEVQKYNQNHKDNIDNTGTTSIIQKKEIVKEQIYQGNLLLINSKQPIRYVGLPHSTIMQKMNLALEEYLDYLKEEESISASIDGKKYTISYYPFFQNKTIDVEIPVN